MQRKTISALRRAFAEIKGSKTNGVSGVWMADSGVPGPVVGITIMTHGNEPSGLAVYDYFRHEFGLEKKLLRGKVYFVLNNLEASRQYLSILGNGNEQEKRAKRFVDLNMNRLPRDCFEGRHIQYEARRARALRKIWDMFQYALDIHSTSQRTVPMVIALGRSKIRPVSWFPIATVITGIDGIQIGKPAAFFYGKRKAEVYAIEAGGHELKNSFRRAVVSTRAFLGSLGVIAEEKTGSVHRQYRYRVVASIIFPDSSYRLVKRIKPFEKIRKGQLLAEGSGKPIIARRAGYALMAPRGRTVGNIKEEVLFLAVRS